MTKLVEELRMYASMSNHPDLLIDAADEITFLRGKNVRLVVALRTIRDMGPMTMDDQRWRVANDALEGM